MNASKMMARMTTTTQKNNTMMPGMACPATVLVPATAASYPSALDLFRRRLGRRRAAGCLRRGSYPREPADRAQQMRPFVSTLVMLPHEVSRASDEQYI